MLVSVELVADFSARCALSVIGPAFLLTRPTASQFANRLSQTPVAARVNGANAVLSAPFAQVDGMLGHKLIDVVVVAVVQAVDVC
jgi:hypothetical protein